MRIGTALLDFRSQSDSYVVIPEETLDVVRKLEPLVPEEQRKEFDEIVAPPREGKEKRLTFDNIYKLVSLIVAIVTIFYYAHEIVIGHQSNEQQKWEKEIQLRDDELELFRECFEYIKENGISIPGQTDGPVEQVEPFSEQVDSLNNSVAFVDHSDNDDVLDEVQSLQE